jgi:hypothetical protein
VDTVRFGKYRFSVTQRLQPDTGWPVQAGGRWGDFFVSFRGAGTSWNGWSFLGAQLRLVGDQKDLPDPDLRGLLLYCTLREVQNSRIQAEAAWQDAAGGYLRVRFVGWRGVDQAGMALRYFPPANRQVAFTGEPNASNVPITLTPQAPDTEVLLLLGDWAEQTYAAPSARYLASLPALTKELADLAALSPPLPSSPAPESVAEVDRLLAAYPDLQQKFGDAISQNREEGAAALQGLAAEDSPPSFVRWYRASLASAQLTHDLLAAYLKAKLCAPS